MNASLLSFRQSVKPVKNTNSYEKMVANRSGRDYAWTLLYFLSAHSEHANPPYLSSLTATMWEEKHYDDYLLFSPDLVG
jgi:hypothetical protein